jgi:guanine deaminase
MTPSDQFTVGGTLVLDAGNATARLARGWLRVAAGRVLEVTLTEDLPKCDLGGDGCLVSPGFVDTHLHLPQFDSIGRRGLELLDWLDTVIYPAEARWAAPDFAAQMTTRVARQLIARGTTAVAAFATVHHAATQAAIDALAEAGLSGCVGQVLMDREAPAELTRPADQLAREVPTLLARGRIQPSVAPRFALSCSDRLLAISGRLAAQTGWIVQTHLAETRRECAKVHELFGGLAYTDVYARAGLLSPRTLLAHGIWLDDADRREIAAAGAAVAHCPTANTFLGAGTMDRSAHVASGVRVTLGSDIAGGPDVSMVRVARAMLDAAATLGHPLPTAAAAWWQITSGNAAALGLPGGGAIARGSPADLLVIRPDLGWEGTDDALGVLLHAWDDRWLKATILQGRVVSLA